MKNEPRWIRPESADSDRVRILLEMVRQRISDILDEYRAFGIVEDVDGNPVSAAPGDYEIERDALKREYAQMNLIEEILTAKPPFFLSQYRKL